MRLALELPAECSCTDRMVFVVLASHADDQTATCWPTKSTISIQAGITERAVAKSLSRLSENEIIHIVRETGKPNIYKIIYKGQTLEPMNLVHPCQTVTHEPRSPLPMNDVHPPMNLVHPPGKASPISSLSINNNTSSSRQNPPCEQNPSVEDKSSPSATPENKDTDQLLNNTIFKTKERTEWRVPNKLYNELINTYGKPKTDACIKAAALWNNSDPTTRKTARGMARFLCGWIARERDDQPQPKRKRFSRSGDLNPEGLYDD